MSAKTMNERLAKIHDVILQNSDDPRVKLMLLERLGGRYMELGAIDETLALLAELRQLARSLDDPSELASIACGFANVYVIPGRYEEAEKEIAAARPSLARLRSDDMNARAECWQAEAELAMLRGQSDRALRVSELSVATFEKVGQVRDTMYMSALNQLALSQAAVGDYPGSYRTTLKARESLKEVGLRGTQQDLTIAMQEVDMLAAGGKPLAASRLLTEIDADPHVAVEHQIPQFALDQRAGVIAAKLGRHADAVAALDASVVEARGAGNKLFAQAGSIRLAEALLAAGRIDAARIQLAAMPDVDAEIARGSPTGARYLAVQAKLALALDDAARADELASKALQVLSRGGPSDPRLRDTLIIAARAAMARQDEPRALRLAQAAVERARVEAIDADSSAAVGEALLVQAQLEAGRGRVAAAASLASEALPHLHDNLGDAHASTVMAKALAFAGGPGQ
jgi:tetratricopeptide (TPR) repeat protein